LSNDISESTVVLNLKLCIPVD